jgi:hypothetical protein
MWHNTIRRYLHHQRNSDKFIMLQIEFSLMLGLCKIFVFLESIKILQLHEVLHQFNFCNSDVPRFIVFNPCAHCAIKIERLKWCEPETGSHVGVQLASLISAILNFLVFTVMYFSIKVPCTVVGRRQLWGERAVSIFRAEVMSNNQPTEPTNQASKAKGGVRSNSDKWSFDMSTHYCVGTR